VTTQSRMPPLPRAEWTDEARKMFTLFEGPDAYQNGSKSKVFLTLARHPELGTSFFKYNGRLLMQSTVDVALREIAILRIAWLYRSPYEWAQHVELSLSAQKIDAEHIEAYKRGEVRVDLGAGVLTPDHIEAVKRGANDPIWTPLQANVIRAVDQLHATGHVDDAIWSELSANLSEKELIELLFFMGTYVMMAWVYNVLGLEPEEHQRKYAEELMARE
jgi:4-carboxymuconolactone decarboxylase